MGVDVFFVISGYLITQHLFREVVTTGTLDLWDFYGRRVRRILPVFFAVTLTTLLLGAFILLPLQNEQSRLARTAMHAAAFMSNFEFARLGGYFDPGTEFNPLLHTWSLSVEEQFYLAWPLALLGLALVSRSTGRLLRSTATTALAIACLVSLIYAIWAAHGEVGTSRRGFFLIWSRIWELGLGSMIAIVLGCDSRRSISLIAAEMITAAGLIAILAAIFLYDERVPYPGIAAVVPVLGAAALIGAGQLAPSTTVSRLLALRSVVLVGLVSYGWYLWHWPLLSLVRIQQMGKPDLLRDASVAAATFFLAVVTWHAIERPVRTLPRFRSRKAVIALGVGGTLVVFAAALGLKNYGWIASYRDPQIAMVAAAVEDINPLRKTCTHGGRFERLVPASSCIVPAESGAPRVVLWGDSHADHLMPMLEELGRRYGLAIMQRTMAGCPPTVGATVVLRGVPLHGCSAFNDAVLDEIADIGRPRLAAVVLAARWTAYQDKPAIALHDLNNRRRLVIPDAPATAQSPIDALEYGLATTLRRLGSTSAPISVVAPVPELKFAAPICLARREPEHCATSRDENERYRADVVGVLSRLTEARLGARLFDPFRSLCEMSSCPAKIGNVVLYSDDDHLTATAARMLATEFAPIMTWFAAEARSGRGF